MRSAPFILLATLTLAGCARPELPEWMVGIWRFQRPAAPGAPQNCAGGLDPRIYRSDGAYTEVNAAEDGRWEIKGKRLIHHPLRVRGRVIPVADRTDYIFRIDARSPDRLDVNGPPADEEMVMLRCGAPPPVPTPAPAPALSPTPAPTRLPAA